MFPTQGIERKKEGGRECGGGGRKRERGRIPLQRFVITFFTVIAEAELVLTSMEMRICGILPHFILFSTQVFSLSLHSFELIYIIFFRSVLMYVMTGLLR